MDSQYIAGRIWPSYAFLRRTHQPCFPSKGERESHRLPHWPLHLWKTRLANAGSCPKCSSGMPTTSRWRTRSCASCARSSSRRSWRRSCSRSAIRQRSSISGGLGPPAHLPPAAALHRTAESVACGCSRLRCCRFSYTLALREKLPIRLAPQPMVTVVPYSSAYTTLSASLG